jgi:hypothetical protein
MNMTADDQKIATPEGGGSTPGRSAILRKRAVADGKLTLVLDSATGKPLGIRTLSENLTAESTT